MSLQTRQYTMPYCGYDDSVYHPQPISHLPITPLGQFQGDDYMSGSPLMYPTPQSLPRASSLGQQSNPHSPALFPSQLNDWNMVPNHVGGGSYSSALCKTASFMAFDVLPTSLQPFDSWGLGTAASITNTPASEMTCFDFDGFVTSAQRHMDDSMPSHTSYNFIDPSHIHSAPSQTLFSNVAAHEPGLSRWPSPFAHMQSQSSFAYHSNQLQRSRSGSPGQRAARHSGSPQDSSKSVNSCNRSRSETEEDGRVRARCPYPDCGRSFKDLKAHMLTHQDERPEKCPIKSCEFNKRGFARKYDRNRHLVTTHYKATIVCGFCPGSGSSTEKTFNRTDVFKRHLTSVHGVEQTSSNRKKSPAATNQSSAAGTDGATGRCSTCGKTFPDAQDLFNHLDDCVLRVVQETNPAEATNERLLGTVADDDEVRYTLERNSIVLPTTEASSYSTEDDGGYQNQDSTSCPTSVTSSRSGKGAMSFKSSSPPTLRSNVVNGRVKKSTSSSSLRPAGLTWSKKGLTLPQPLANASQKRKDLPSSWGAPADTVNLKKRVLCVFDGQRRLWKDELMVNNDFEIRIDPDGHGQSYVTDFDVETIKRAENFLGATEEERGPWIATNVPGFDVNPLLA